MRIAVIGAGISGLSISYFLTKKGHTVDLFHDSNGVGGLIGTTKTEFGLCEQSASGIMNNSVLEEISRELNLKLIVSDRAAKARWIFRGSPKAAPMSAIGGTAKLKILWVILQYFFRRSRIQPQSLETIREWCLRVFNAEIYEYLVEPALQGIYASEASSLSASLILKRLFNKGNWGMYKPKLKGLVSFQGGLQELTDALYTFASNHGRVNARHVDTIDPLLSHYGHIVIATNVHMAAHLVRDIAPFLSSQLEGVEMLNIASISHYYSKSEEEIGGFGCLFPRKEKIQSLGLLFNDKIFPSQNQGKAPASLERWILSWEQGQSEDLEAVVKSDHEQFWKSLGTDHRPSFLGAFLNIWPQALPRYTVELEKKLSHLETGSPHFSLHGNYLGEIGIGPILVKSKQLADKIDNYFPT